MFVELHILQNFAPSNLNRDDTGAPKDCEFGGYRRARVSSQCIKRAIRETFRREGLLPKDNLAALATRTKRVVEAVAKRLQEGGKPLEEAQRVVVVALQGMELKVDDKTGKTEYLLFLGEAEMAALAKVCATHWDSLRQVASAPLASDGEEATTGGRTRAQRTKAAGKKLVPTEVLKALEQVLDGRKAKAADLALFGRMLADLPQRNIDAACQVAHAISTHRISTEFDFYTAVDQLRPEDTAGADMMGTVEFNSACFYRYANVDAEQLKKNLDGDAAVARMTVEAFVRAAIVAVPSGKQNSMAAQNPPSLVLAVVREGGLWSLANAFVKPVHPGHEGDLVAQSVSALDAYWGKLTKMYGPKQLVGQWVCALDGDGLVALAGAQVDDCEQLVARVLSATDFQDAGRGAA